MLERLIFCAAANTEQARKGRWLNGILLSFIALGAIIVLLTAVLLPPSSAQLSNTLAVLVLVGVYFVCRRGYVTAATLMLIAILAVASVEAGFGSTAGLDTLSYPPLLILAIIVAGVFLSWRWVLATMALIGGLVVWYYYFSPITALQELRIQQP